MTPQFRAAVVQAAAAGFGGQVLQYNTQADLSFRAACVTRSKARLTVA
jgi:predicted enzyme related to lactoylglutathione lyase